MRSACLIALLLAGCATQHRPEYNKTVTYLEPDCANKMAQVRYYEKLKKFPVMGDDDMVQYNRTIDLQIERLYWYCK